MRNRVANNGRLLGQFVFTVTETVTNVLASRPFVHRFVAVLGLTLLICGVIFSLLWSVPILLWLKGGDIAVSMLFMGGGILGLWYVSLINNREPR